MPALVHFTDGRLAIRVERDGKPAMLAVPRWHPKTPRSARVRILEYVLRGQIDCAMTLAEIERDMIQARDRLDRSGAIATEQLMSDNWETGEAA